MNNEFYPLLIKSNAESVAKLLVDAGADPNSESRNGATPIAIAALNGNPGVLAVLASHPNTKLDCQVCSQLVYCMHTTQPTFSAHLLNKSV